MKNWIFGFLNDERGAETIELGVTGVVVAGGIAIGMANIKTKLAEKQTELVAKLDAATAS